MGGLGGHVLGQLRKAAQRIKGAPEAPPPPPPPTLVELAKAQAWGELGTRLRQHEWLAECRERLDRVPLEAALVLGLMLTLALAGLAMVLLSKSKGTRATGTATTLSEDAIVPDEEKEEPAAISSSFPEEPRADEKKETVVAIEKVVGRECDEPAPPAATGEEEEEEEESVMVQEDASTTPPASEDAAADGNDGAQGVEEEKKWEREDTILDLSQLPAVSSMTSMESTLAPIEETPPLELRWPMSEAGDVGGRKQMEDVTCLVPQGCAVFDGAGGRRAADACARAFRASFGSPGASTGDLRAAVAKMEQAALAAATRSGKWPDATTATCCLYDGRTLSLAWVGDSPALLVSEHGWTFLTTPHVAANADEARRVKAAGGRVGRSETEAQASRARKLVGKIAPGTAFRANKNNPKRIYPGGITLTRALGGLPLKYARPKLVLAEPQARVLEVLPRDHVALVLATDGLFEKLSPDDVANLLRASAPSRAADALVAQALEVNTTDNVACACLFFSDR